MTEQPLFEIPFPSALERVAPTTTKARWSPVINRTRIKCDDCVWIFYKHKGMAPQPRLARQRRSHGFSDRLLCDEHAQHWKDLDT